MNKNLLWALAVLAILGPCLYMQSGSADAMSGAAKMALAQQMRIQAMLFESQMGETLGMSLQPRAIDAAYLKEITAQLNAQNGAPMSPQEARELKKEGVNPKLAPKVIPWVVAPEKQPRTLSIGVVGKDLLMRGWGTDLKEPIYEHQIRNVIPN